MAHRIIRILVSGLLPLPIIAFSGLKGYTVQNAGASTDTISIFDYIDQTYGSRVRQLKKDYGHEHNLYYSRCPWNTDSSRMVGIHSDLQQQNWHVVLYDGQGHFLKELFGVERFDWRLVWDRTDPDILYTWKGANLYRYNVQTGSADLLKCFAPLTLKPNGPSLNQSGDRILVVTSDNTFRSYRLPDMEQQHSFKPSIPPGCFVSWDKPAYTGYHNHIHVPFSSPDQRIHGILLYDDIGTLLHTFEAIGGGGHYAFSPDGKLAYFRMARGPRQGGPSPLEIHVVNIDGTNDRVLYSASWSAARYVQNLHLSWPSKVDDYFFASFFPSAQNLPPKYAPLLDEILRIRLDGTTGFLARTETVYSRLGARGSSGDMFWAQPLASPSIKGDRVCFNSIRSRTIDQYILFVEK